MSYPWVVLTPEFKETLKELTEYRDILNFEEGEVVALSGTTRTLRVTLRGIDIYLKTYRYPKLIIKYSFLKSRVHYEWKSIHFLQKIGLNTPEAVAYGEDRGFFFRLKSCLILTKGVPNSKNLDEFLPEFFQRDPTKEWQAQKKKMILLLSEHVATMHQNYFIAHDLFWRNVLIQEEPELKFYFIDSPKGEQANLYLEPFRMLRMNWGRVKDLASLDKTAPEFFSRVDRLRFLKNYLQQEKKITKKEPRSWAKKVQIAAKKMRARTENKLKERKKLSLNIQFAAGMQELFQQEQLDEYNSILVAEGEKVSSHGTRKVIKKTFSNKMTIFIKISKYPHLKNLLPLMLHGIFSVSRKEKMNLELLHQEGFATPDFIALGEKIKHGLEQSSFLILKELPKVKSLEDKIETLSSENLFPLLKEISLLLRKLHQKGIYHRDLYTKHLLWSQEQWYLIDLQRLCQKSGFLPKLAAHDLAGLVATCQVRKITRKFHGRFLRYYLTGENRALTLTEKKEARILLLQIQKRFQKLKKRKKFQKYLNSEESDHQA